MHDIKTYRRKWLSSYFLERIEQIVTKVNFIIEHNKSKNEHSRFVTFFTPHDKSHLLAVEGILYDLIPESLQDKLSENERFFLIGGAWLHDIGMVDGLFDKDTELDDFDIRDIHHERSERYIIDFNEYLHINDEEAEIFAMLANFHRRRSPITECPGKLKVPKHGNIRVRLLAAYLRLADALHIDHSRTPTSKYAITLTYNIPTNSKLHWLRSMFVTGIKIDHKLKEIKICFKFPRNYSSVKEINPKMMEITLNDIYDNIKQDLISELNTIKEILYQADISYFIRVSYEIHKIYFNPNILHDISAVLNYYHLLDNPSSSALYRLVLESLISIIQQHEKKENQNSSVDLKQMIDIFLDEIRANILKTRQCHIGLRKLVNDLKSQINDENDTSENFIKKIILKENNSIRENRNDIRKNAKIYFQTRVLDERPQKKYNILLYGYSELVIKSICGFRDAVIERNIKEICTSHNYEELVLHKKTFEQIASDNFRIFVCEGQPKNSTGWGGSVFYHDGISYAQSLKEHGFTEIYIVADAISGTLIKNQKSTSIDFIMVGANGFDEDKFIHSAGHANIALLSQGIKKNSQKIDEENIYTHPELILCLLTQKYSKKSYNNILHQENNNQGQYKKTKKSNNPESVKVDGWYFQNSFDNETIRANPFFTQDQRLKNILEMNNSVIKFYNPREDSIPFEWVDVVITEKAWAEKQFADQWDGEFISDNNICSK